MKRRDVTLLDLPGGDRLIIACDVAGGIGPKVHDRIKAPGYLLGRLTARVALMELIAAGGRPIALVDTCAVEPEPAGADILRGVRDEAALAGLAADAITGSFEKNIPVVQTGLGVTAIGLAIRTPPVARVGDVIVAIGHPKVGSEVAPDDPDAADLPLLQRLMADPLVHDIVPVGSRGLAAEAAELAAAAGAELELTTPEEGWDFAKSAGPATSLLAATSPAALPGLVLSLSRPWTILGRLTTEGGGSNT